MQPDKYHHPISRVRGREKIDARWYLIRSLSLVADAASDEPRLLHTVRGRVCRRRRVTCGRRREENIFGFFVRGERGDDRVAGSGEWGSGGSWLFPGTQVIVLLKLK